MKSIQNPIPLINPAEDLTSEKVKELLDPNAMRGYPTGIETLDKIILGIKPGLYIFSAVRGTGKTWFALQMAKALWISSEIRSIFFTLEMTTDQLQQRCLQAWSGLTEEEVRAGKNIDKGLAHLKEGFLQFAPVYDEPNFDYSSFEAEIERGKSMGIKLFILDHLHLVRGASSREALNVLADWASESKKLASRLGVTIWILAQPTKYSEGKIIVSDSIKGTGAIPDAADVVITLSRERKDLKEKPSNDCWLSVEKNRLGGHMYEGFSLAFTDRGEFVETNAVARKQEFIDNVFKEVIT